MHVTWYTTLQRWYLQNWTEDSVHLVVEEVFSHTLDPFLNSCYVGLVDNVLNKVILFFNSTLKIKITSHTVNISLNTVYFLGRDYTVDKSISSKSWQVVMRCILLRCEGVKNKKHAIPTNSHAGTMYSAAL